MAVKIDLKNTEKRIANLLKIDKLLMQIGFKTKLHIVENWIQGRGADEKKFKPTISKVYGKRKEKSGRRGMIDMVWTGRMAQSLEPKQKGKTKVILTFSQAEMPKARGNYNIRPKMMTLSKRFKDKMQELALKFLGN